MQLYSGSPTSFEHSIRSPRLYDDIFKVCQNRDFAEENSFSLKVAYHFESQGEDVRNRVIVEQRFYQKQLRDTGHRNAEFEQLLQRFYNFAQ